MGLNWATWFGKVYLGVEPKIEDFPPKWMVKIIENPMKLDDLGGKPTIFGNTHFFHVGHCSKLGFFSPFLGGFPLVAGIRTSQDQQMFRGPLLKQKMSSRWWQLKDLLFSPLLGGRFPILTSIFFRRVETTN